jgi:propionyl-CoA synthetase
MVDRHLSEFVSVAGRDFDYAKERDKHLNAQVPCNGWSPPIQLHPLHSGTTGKPKGVQRDTGGYAVAFTPASEYFQGKPGETFCYHEHWLGGRAQLHHYGPLIGGMATILYEGLPVAPTAVFGEAHYREIQSQRHVQCAHSHSRFEKARPSATD